MVLQSELKHWTEAWDKLVQRVQASQMLARVLLTSAARGWCLRNSLLGVSKSDKIKQSHLEEMLPKILGAMSESNKLAIISQLAKDFSALRDSKRSSAVDKSFKYFQNKCSEITPDELTDSSVELNGSPNPFDFISRNPMQTSRPLAQSGTDLPRNSLVSNIDSPARNNTNVISRLNKSLDLTLDSTSFTSSHPQLNTATVQPRSLSLPSKDHLQVALSAETDIRVEMDIDLNLPKELTEVNLDMVENDLLEDMTLIGNPKPTSNDNNRTSKSPKIPVTRSRVTQKTTPKSKSRNLIAKEEENKIEELEVKSISHSNAPKSKNSAETPKSQKLKPVKSVAPKTKESESDSKSENEQSELEGESKRNKENGKSDNSSECAGSEDNNKNTNRIETKDDAKSEGASEDQSKCSTKNRETSNDKASSESESDSDEKSSSSNSSASCKSSASNSTPSKTRGKSDESGSNGSSECENRESYSASKRVAQKKPKGNPPKKKAQRPSARAAAKKSPPKEKTTTRNQIMASNNNKEMSGENGEDNQKRGVATSTAKHKRVNDAKNDMNTSAKKTSNKTGSSRTIKSDKVKPKKQLKAQKSAADKPSGNESIEDKISNSSNPSSSLVQVVTPLSVPSGLSQVKTNLSLDVSQDTIDLTLSAGNVNGSLESDCVVLSSQGPIDNDFQPTGAHSKRKRSDPQSQQSNKRSKSGSGAVSTTAQEIVD